jgi:hypothetical protein
VTPKTGLEYAAHLHHVDGTCQLTTTFGVVFHIFPIDFPHCCHAFDDSYHGLYVTNLLQDMGKLWVRGVAKVWVIKV